MTSISWSQNCNHQSDASFCGSECATKEGCYKADPRCIFDPTVKGPWCYYPTSSGTAKKGEICAGDAESGQLACCCNLYCDVAGESNPGNFGTCVERGTQGICEFCDPSATTGLTACGPGYQCELWSRKCVPKCPGYKESYKKSSHSSTPNSYIGIY